MSLLDTASLICTPNGYKEGKLYSVIPSDGSGDMSVVRATTATRVNSAGLVELVPYNIFTYSSSFSNAAWGKLNATVTGGQSGYDGTTNAFLLTDDSTSGVHVIAQVPIVSGQHTISIYAKANTLNWVWLRGVQSSSNVRAWFNLSTGTIGTVETNGTANIESVGNGWYRCSLTIANHESGFEFYYGVSNADNTLSYVGSGQSIFVQDAQLVEGSTAKDYQKTETRLNIPRLDYSNGTCPSLLVEPQRTNLALFSEQFDNAAWSKFALGSATAPVVTANYSISPDGTQNADRFECSRTGTGSLDFSLMATASNIILSATGTASIWMKSNTSSTQNVLCYWGGGQGAVFAVTTEWQRFTLSGLSSATNAIVLGTRGGSGNYFNGGDTAIDVSIWGAQLEVGNYSTSYIPTTSASVTRNADQLFKTSATSLIGQTEGTIFAEIEVIDGTDNFGVWMRQSGSLYNNIILMYFNSSRVSRAEVISGSAYQANITGTAVTAGFHKIALAYKNNDFALYVDGVLIGTDTSGSVPTCNEIYLDQYIDGGIRNANKKSVALWKTRLTNDQLATLTTL